MYLYIQATFELHKKFYNFNMSWYKLSQFKSDLIDTDRELYKACPKLIAYCDTILKKEDIIRLIKDNLLYFKNIDEKEIYCFSRFKYDIYNLHIKALNSDINFNEIIRVFQTFNNCVLMKNNFWL